MLCAPLSAWCVAGFRVGPGGQASLKMPRLETLDYARRERSGSRGGNVEFAVLIAVVAASRWRSGYGWVAARRRWIGAPDAPTSQSKTGGREGCCAYRPMHGVGVALLDSCATAPAHTGGSARAPVGGPDTDRELVEVLSADNGPGS